MYQWSGCPAPSCGRRTAHPARRGHDRRLHRRNRSGRFREAGLGDVGHYWRAIHSAVLLRNTFAVDRHSRHISDSSPGAGIYPHAIAVETVKGSSGRRRWPAGGQPDMRCNPDRRASEAQDCTPAQGVRQNAIGERAADHCLGEGRPPARLQDRRLGAGRSRRSGGVVGASADLLSVFRLLLRHMTI
jgi:hypothetical protein